MISNRHIDVVEGNENFSSDGSDGTLWSLVSGHESHDAGVWSEGAETRLTASNRKTVGSGKRRATSATRIATISSRTICSSKIFIR